MATAYLFDEFISEVLIGTHVIGTDTFRVALTNFAPNQHTGALLSDITQITGGGTTGYTVVTTSAGQEVTLTKSEPATGTWQLGDTTNIVFTAGADGMGPFQWAVIVNTSKTGAGSSPKLLGYINYGSPVTLSNGNTFTLDPGADGWFKFPVTNEA